MNDEELDSFKAVEESMNRAYTNYLKNAYSSYIIEGMIGRGGFGQVFACRDRNYHYEARAVKVMRLQEFDPDKKEKEIETIKKEFDLQWFFGDVSVQTYQYPDVKKDDVFFCVSMEMMDGTLRDLLKNHNNCFDAVDTVRIMKEVSLLVERLHNNKKPLPEKIRMQHDDTSVAHFDLKPENIFYKMERGKRVFKLGDYGCSRLADGTQSRVRGTETYMSLTPSEETGCQRDIYALGIILIELQGVAVAKQNLKERFKSETMWEHTEVPIDPDLREISRKACSTEPEKRYTINGFIDALDEWLKEHEDEVLIKDGSAEILLTKAEAFEKTGGPIPMERARKYYEAAVKKGSGKAAYRLYKILYGDAETDMKETAMELLEKSKSLNYAPAVNEYTCRKIKELGPDGDPEEMVRMAELLRQIAAVLPAAAYNLALLMKAGLAAEETEGEANQLLMSAVDSNYKAAVSLQDALNHDTSIQE